MDGGPSVVVTVTFDRRVLLGQPGRFAFVKDYLSDALQEDSELLDRKSHQPTLLA